LAAINKSAVVQELLNPANRTLGAAAQAAGISEKTLRRLRRDPEFGQLLDQATAAVVDEVAGRVVGSLPRAETVFLQMMIDPAQSPGIRLRAAEGLVELAFRLFELRNLERRISALEGAQDASY
jgi:hypothetical protein